MNFFFHVFVVIQCTLYSNFMHPFWFLFRKEKEEEEEEKKKKKN